MFGTIKAWMGAMHVQARRFRKVATEMSLHILAYELKRIIALLRPAPFITALRA